MSLNKDIQKYAFLITKREAQDNWALSFWFVKKYKGGLILCQ